MSDVPSELHREILLRLPAESLFRFRSVCKSWLRIIDDPSFIRSHTTNNHLSSSNLLISRTSTGILHSFPLDSLNFITGQQTVYVTWVKNLTRPGVPRLLEFPVSTCNGLILISHSDRTKTWVIWNPSTADFHELPQPDVIKPYQIGVGIGYDSISDDYKVVRIDEIRIDSKTVVYQTLIYSLRSNSWAIAEDCPRDFNKRSEGVFLNGALHWRSWDMIVALDMATGTYRRLPLPNARTRLPMDVRLDALGGCLILSEAVAIQCAWVMRGYKTEEPFWVELFSPKERSALGASGSMWPIAYYDNQRRLILQRDNKIICWDIEKLCSKKVTIDGLPGFVTSQVVPGSLFRFNGGGGGSTERTAGVKRKRSYNPRLKLSATTVDSGCLSDPYYYSDDEAGVGDGECYI